MQVSRFPRAFGLIEMFVLAFWVGLWAVWPRVAPPRVGGGDFGELSRPAAPRVRWVGAPVGETSPHQRPDLIAHTPLEEEAWMAAADDVLPSALPRRRHARSHPLPMPAPAATAGGCMKGRLSAASPSKGARFPGNGGRGCAEPSAYRPLPAPTVGEAPAPAAPAARAELSRGLTAAGIGVAEDVLADLGGVREAPWQVAVSVMFTDPDRPAEVFVEVPCEDQRVNAAVVSALHRARAPAGTAPCRGRITVSYGNL